MRETTQPLWDMNVQRMVDFIERNINDEIRLNKVAERLGYSPYHCTRQFHRVIGMSLRRYVGLRRLSIAAQNLRDTDKGILEIALSCGFSSQEALTRAFVREWGYPPGTWRRQPVVIRLLSRRGAVLPLAYNKELQMHTVLSSKIDFSFQKLPAQRFIGLKIKDASDYMDFWAKAATLGLDCHEIIDTLSSLTANAQIGGWYEDGTEKGYLYGVELPLDYQGPVPDNMENMVIPAAEYAVFHYPPYDFVNEDVAVWHALKQALADWNPADHGRVWNSSIPMWQRHDSEKMGQAWCKAVRKI